MRVNALVCQSTSKRIDIKILFAVSSYIVHIIQCHFYSLLVDHSRVKLQPFDSSEGSDYIHANYLPVCVCIVVTI